MKTKWYLLAGIFIGLLSVPFIRNIKGSTYILFEKTAFEFQNSFAISMLLVCILFFWLAWILIRYLLRTSSWTLGWFGDRGSKKARQNTIDGMIALAEGHWKTAESLLNKSAISNDTKLINYLAAARAAQEQGDSNSRDNYLKLAATAQPEATVAVGLTQAQLQIHGTQYEQALATLNHLRSISPHHPHVLKLLHQLHTKLEDWSQVLSIIPKLKKNRVLAEEDIFASEVQANSHQLNKAGTNNLEHLQNVWSSLTKPLRKNQQLQSAYIHSLVELSEVELAEQQIRASIKQQWNNDLISLYGDLQITDHNKQLANAEQWLKLKPQNQSLLICLGKLSLRAQLWGKAKSYLEQALNSEASSQAYFYLAQALEELGHPLDAQKMYRQGLENQIKS